MEPQPAREDITSPPSHIFAMGFEMTEITSGPYANGFGRTEDGRPFSFRVVDGTARLRVYRIGLAPGTVPGRADVEAVATSGVCDVDLSDERSVIAMVRDMCAHATPPGRSGRFDPVAVLRRWLP